jgi:hypothetical protein
MLNKEKTWNGLIWCKVRYSETSQNRPALGAKIRGVAGFVRLPLQRIVKQGL